MTMRKAGIIITILGTALFLMCSLGRGPLSLAQDFAPTQELEAKEGGGTKQERVDIGQMPTVEYSASGLRDPFQSYITSGNLPSSRGAEISGEQALPSLEVQGIIWGGSFPQAIINHKVVKVGDTLEGVRIIAINQQGVIVFFGSRQYSLVAPGISTGKPKNQGGENENAQGIVTQPYIGRETRGPLF